jgi:hypothetical protein
MAKVPEITGVRLRLLGCPAQEGPENRREREIAMARRQHRSAGSFRKILGGEEDVVF